VAPAGTPADIVERLSGELRAAVMSEEVREQLLNEGAQPVASTPAEYAAEIDFEERKWSAVVRRWSDSACEMERL
jgi:tripartite-type tricarboxylate transporter receptor subunit TctC